jgi:broad specificity phosphatase PhoE
LLAAEECVRSLFFIGRHGETGLNQSGRYRGWSNGPDAQLNEDGIQSAHEAGVFLQKTGQKFGRIITSPLNRAQYTGAIIAQYLGLKTIEVDERLKPLDVGDLAGQLKIEHPIGSYLKNKNKRFPNGGTVNEFEATQHSFATDLLNDIEKSKSEEDVETLVIAHVSNVMYWWNVQTSEKSDEYLDEATDLIKPGGLAIVTEHAVLPIFKENEGEGELPVGADIHGEPVTGFEKRGSHGPFECGNCTYFSNGQCSQEVMVAKSRLPRADNDNVLVDAADCCAYLERKSEEK